jgi:magnesium transporter
VGLKIFFLGANEAHGDLSIIPKVMFTVCAAFIIQVVSSTSMGALLPIAAKACRLDPAVLAAPMITTFVDVSGLLIYFTTARLIMGV